MKKLFFAFLAIMLPFIANAQRFTDKLNRGLIAQKTAKGVLVSWRILGEEYYDVQYNVYRDGAKINETPLNVSNYVDASGSTTSSYTVAPVVRGVEQAQSKAVKPWSSSYIQVNLKHEGIASTLVPNDACCADVDGDGELEVIMKFDNASEINNSYPREGGLVNGVYTKEYSIFEVFKLDGTRLWWVNCGPNMGDFQNNEQNVVGYDWNMDGKAEVLMRLEEGSTIHYADGSTYTIGANGQNGTSWTNYRAATGGGTNWFMCVGKEFLVYCNGETGKVYDIIDYPLARLEAGETYAGAWGKDDGGHRASKFFFGAPYLDGKHPSIFLARGIYTQIKMCAFDVNTTTNKLVKRWDWRQTNGGYWMWQGYHNFGIADVDMDGRDEICYGSMVVDDNGKGLSTTGLGHGDAQHHGDFNPYIHGLEIYACNEEQPGNNYRDGTTSKIYHRFSASNDDGRAMAGNFTNDYPGAQGCSSREGLISLVYNNTAPGLSATGVNTNFRIYWDGDLLEETFNGEKTNDSPGVIAKYGSWSPIYTCQGSLTNNYTKATPCYQGDILGDWREEIIMRTPDNNIRIYSTPTPTEYRNYTLWHDHQYRNAMVWQMCGYNQPPHVSYFLGEMEGITQAPPPLTMTDRTEITNGGTIGDAVKDKHAIVCEAGNSNVTIQEGASPYIMTFNVPSWVQGTAGTNYTAKDAEIKYEYYTCNVTGGAMTGGTRLVKQGDGLLNLPKVAMTYTGPTEIWEGKVNFDGSMNNSDVWLNRFTELTSNGGSFKSIRSQYDSKLYPGGKGTLGNITVLNDLVLDYGSRIVIDINGTECDKISAKSITLVKKTGEAWTKYGPQYISPVLEINANNAVEGDYVIAECDNIDGSLTSFKILDVEGFKTALRYENKKIILSLGGTRGATEVYWTGKNSNVWEYGGAENFVCAGSETPDIFVNGDLVEFNDEAAVFNPSLTGNIYVDTVKVINNAKTYSFIGTGSIVQGALAKEGAGQLSINTTNTYSGGNYLKGGTVLIKTLANSVTNSGSLGARTTIAAKFSMENGATLKPSGAVTNGSPMLMKGEQGGVINNTADFVQEQPISGTLLTKKGSGWLKTTVANTGLDKLVVEAGTLAASTTPARTVELKGTASLEDYGSTSYTIMVSGTNNTWTPATNQSYGNKITGSGTITIKSAAQKGSGWYATRTPLTLNLSEFTGTLKPTAVYTDDGRFTFDTSSGSNKFKMDIASGIHVQNSGKTMSIGQITGSGSLGGFCAFRNGVATQTNTWNVGNEGNFTFAGSVTSGDKFNKVGTGMMTATGMWDCTGTVTVKEGTLKVIVPTNSSIKLGTGMLVVDKGAAFVGNSGTSKLCNSSVTINGVIRPTADETTISGTMLFNNQNVTISSTGELRVNCRKPSREGAPLAASAFSGSGLKNINTLTINGRIVINLLPSYTSTIEPKKEPMVGDTLHLFVDVKTFAGTPVVMPSKFNDKIVYFATDKYNSDGLIYIRKICLSGDANGDGKVTIADANMVINHILGRSMSGFDAEAADIDGDGKITKADADLIVSSFLGAAQ